MNENLEYLMEERSSKNYACGTSGAGWTCSQCGQWIPVGCGHVCPTTWVYPQTDPSVYYWVCGKCGQLVPNGMYHACENQMLPKTSVTKAHVCDGEIRDLEKFGNCKFCPYCGKSLTD